MRARPAVKSKTRNRASSQVLAALLIVTLALAMFLTLPGCTGKQTGGSGLPQPVKPVPSLPDGPTLLKQARAAMADGDFTLAEDAYTRFLGRFPAAPERGEAWLALGRTALYGRNYEAAAGWFGRYLDQFADSPQAPAARLGLARARLGLGSPLPALEMLLGLDAKSLPPEQRAEYFLVKARARFALDQPKSALEALIKGRVLAGQSQAERFAAALEEMAAQWSEEELVELAELHYSPFPTVYLLGALVDKALARQDWTRALAFQNRLLEDFPNHPASMARTRGLDWSKLEPGREWTIGCLLPLSGPLAEYGEKLLEGMQLAAEVFNPHSPFRLVIEDTADDPLVAVEALERLALTEDAVAVVGPLSGRLAKAGAARAGELELPLITLTQNRQVAEAGPWVLRDFITPGDQIDALAQRVVYHLLMKRIAILYPDMAYGRRMARTMTEAVERQGGMVVHSMTYPADSVDLAEQLLAMGGTAPDSDRLDDPTHLDQAEDAPVFDALFLPDSYLQAAQIAPQLAFYDLTPTVLLGTNLWHNDELIDLAGPYIQGAIFPSSFFPDSGEAHVRSFVRRFVETYGRRPDRWAALGYDAVRLVVDVILHQGAEERRELLDHLLAVRGYPGVTGLTSVNENGEAIKEPYMVTVEGKRFKPAPRWPEPTEP